MFKHIKNKYITLFLLIMVLLTITIFGFIKFKNSDLLSGVQMVQVEEESKMKNQENNDIKINEANNINEQKKTAKITVYITGEVSSQGVITLEGGSRLDDGIKKLGGVTKNADLNSINLAMRMEDGQHYIIPNKNDTQIQKNKSASNEKENPKDKKDTDIININKASKEELESLPGVGPSTAKKIIDYRETKEFSSIEDIKNINGIGDKKFESIKDYINVN